MEGRAVYDVWDDEEAAGGPSEPWPRIEPERRVSAAQGGGVCAHGQRRVVACAARGVWCRVCLCVWKAAAPLEGATSPSARFWAAMIRV